GEKKCFYAKHECSNDYECSGHLKCCCKGCSRVCAAPYAGDVKSGLCPSSSFFRDVKTSSQLRHQCSNDRDCSNDYKCCYSGYERVCVAPYRVKSGFCPIFNWFKSKKCRHVQHRCSHDDHCQGHYKCCYRGCGRVCVAPFGNNGKCRNTSRRKCPKFVKHACYKDSDCPSHKRCCVRGCRRTCVPQYRHGK
uniref:WAP domain-containing protein n=1 Tax=Salarias fasciatus TaxID=181472 RepID=A0A672IRD9_SALFA